MEQENELSNFTLFVVAASMLAFGYYVLSGHHVSEYSAQMQNTGMEEAGVLNAMDGQQEVMGGYKQSAGEEVLPEHFYNQMEGTENMEQPQDF